MAAGKAIRYQYAGLPYRVVDDRPEIVLVTSRETKRWILPKGQPEKGHHAWEVAAQEVYEEAGLVGSVSVKSIGAYESTKRMRSGLVVPCVVRVFLFAVESVLDDWPERTQRERRWTSPSEAALMVTEPQLASLLLDFGALWA